MNVKAMIEVVKKGLGMTAGPGFAVVCGCPLDEADDGKICGGRAEIPRDLSVMAESIVAVADAQRMVLAKLSEDSPDFMLGSGVSLSEGGGEPGAGIADITVYRNRKAVEKHVFGMGPGGFSETLVIDLGVTRTAEEEMEVTRGFFDKLRKVCPSSIHPERLPFTMEACNAVMVTARLVGAEMAKAVSDGDGKGMAGVCDAVVASLEAALEQNSGKTGGPEGVELSEKQGVAPETPSVKVEDGFEKIDA